MEIERTDGIFAAFDSPDDALGFAVAYQRALKRLTPPLVARVGVHTAPSAGARPPRPAPGEGPRLVTGVMSVARGGQVLITRESLPPTDLEVTAHGHWRVRDLDEPVEICEVSPEASAGPPGDADEAFQVVRQGPHWVPARDLPHALPSEDPGPFVGRRTARARLGALLRGTDRLVTIRGLGGSGKTRLAVHTAWRHLGEQAGGAWLLDLRAAVGVAEVEAVAGRTLGVPPSDVGRGLAELGPCTVILDGLAVAPPVAKDTLGAWLRRAGEAHFWVTSRRALGLPGELTLALPPLSVEEGTALFAAWAREAPGFAVGRSGVREAIASLVEAVDGLPGAIRHLARQVGERSVFELEEAVHTSLAARVATVGGALDDDWARLADEERSALAQLSVFVGRFTLESCEEVLELGESWPIDVVQQLTDASLVTSLGDGVFVLPGMVRAYAAARLDERGDRPATEARYEASSTS